MNEKARTESMTIRQLQESDSLVDITELLHRSYAALAVQGLHFLASHQDVETTRTRMNGELSFVVEYDSSIVATVSLYRNVAESECQWYRLNNVWHFGQFGIEPSLQKNGLGSALMQHIENCARANGAEELACDTAEPAEHLVRWYTKMGYRFIQHIQWDVVNYRSVILSKNLLET